MKVLLYHPPTPLNDPQGEWKSEVIDESMHMTHNFDPAKPSDSNHDQFLLGGKEGIALVRARTAGWQSEIVLKNDGSADGPVGVGEIRLGMFQPLGENLATIEPMHGNNLAVYLPDKRARSLKRHILTDKLTEGHALATGDLLKTGSSQIVVGWRGTPGKEGSTTGVAVWTPLDNAGEKWRETVIDPDGMACEDLQLADLNGDGRLDIVASGRATQNVKIYWNETPRPR